MLVPAATTHIDRFRELLRFLKGYVRDPIGTLRRPLPYGWLPLLSLQLGVAVISGVVSGLLGFNFIDFLLGLLIFPIISVLSSLLLAFFLFYYFSIFQETFLEVRRLYSIVVLASIPYFVLHIIAGFLPPIDLIGFGFTVLALIVGLSEQFGLDKKRVMQLLGGLYLIFLFAWSVAQIRAASALRSETYYTQPQSLDDLERSMKADE